VKKLAQLHLDELQQQIQRLQEMHNTLQHLVDACQGNNHPHCPILKDLSAE
jgi:DNA-binding transcriptional MerR regulator